MQNDRRVQHYKAKIERLLREVDQLKSLPLFVSHFDLNQLNILVDEKYQVTGIIDWEYSRNLLFGMRFSRIHTLAGEISDGEFNMPETFELLGEGILGRGFPWARTERLRISRA